jgi:hypothetical protein
MNTWGDLAQSEDHHRGGKRKGEAHNHATIMETQADNMVSLGEGSDSAAYNSRRRSKQQVT